MIISHILNEDLWARYRTLSFLGKRKAYFAYTPDALKDELLGSRRKYFPREWWTRDCRWRWQVEVKIDVGRNVMTYLRFSYLCDSTATSICGKPFISSNGPATFRRRLSTNPAIKGGRETREMYASLRIFSDLADDGNSLKISLCFWRLFLLLFFFLCALNFV